MVDATRALLDELMGAERNAPLSQRNNDDGGERGSGAGASRRRLPRFDDDDVCKLELAGLCPHGLFTNTRSDLGPCRWRVHADALAWESLQKQYDEEVKPEERRDRRSRRSYGFALRDQLAVLVRDLDRRIERARREREAIDAARAEAFSSNPVLLAGGGGLRSVEGTAKAAAGAALAAKDSAATAAAPEGGQQQQQQLLQPGLQPLNTVPPLLPEDAAIVADLRSRASAATAAADEAAGEGDVDRAMTLAAEGESLSSAADAARAAGVTRVYTARAAEAAAAKAKAVAEATAAAAAAAAATTAAVDLNPLAPLPPSRPPITVQQHLRPCEVSGILLAVNETEARLREHYAGKQYQGWKAIRETLARLVEELGPPSYNYSGASYSNAPHLPASSSGPPPPLSRGSRERDRDSRDRDGYYRGGSGRRDDDDRSRRRRSRSRERERERGGGSRRRSRSRSRSKERGSRGGGGDRDRERDYHHRGERDRGGDRRRSRSREEGETRGGR